MADTPWKTYMLPDLWFHLRTGLRPADEGIAPGTRWEDVPPNWTCPECNARKEDFEMVEIRRGPHRPTTHQNTAWILPA